MVPVKSMAVVLSIDGCAIRCSPGRALSPCLILHYLHATASVVVVELKILETIKWSGLFMPWPNPGDPVCQDLTQRLWTNHKMVKTKGGDR